MAAMADGRIVTHARLGALARSGWLETKPDRLIPLPDGAALMHLPGRHLVARDPSGARVVVGQMAVAAVLPPGYLRTWLPAYEEKAGAPVLPLYGYAAVASVDGRPYVAAQRTDRWEAWNPARHDDRRVERGITSATRALPQNRLVGHLATCAGEYRCLTAKNLFIRSGEGAIPVSPACNAACLGCISEQWGDVDSPQTRLAFAPTPIEIAELAAWHLAAAPTNFVSFGQGCEGEPLTRGRALVEATRRIHAAAPNAAIHINTNGSRPDVLEDLIRAGLNSARISIFSLDDECFRAYYRPVGYGLAEVAACADSLRDAGAQVTVNLLTFPGITDRPVEIDALVAFVHHHGVRQVQLRSLNVDPLWLLRQVPRRSPGIGMRAFVRQFRQRCPEVRLGNFTRTWAQPVRSLLGIP